MEHKKFSDFITSGEACALMGVSQNTFNSWRRKGIIKSYKNKLAPYPLYLKDELEKLLVFEMD